MTTMPANNFQGAYWLSGPDLKVPVCVKVQVTADGFVVTNVDTGIFGSGGSLDEAVDDVRRALHEHYDLLEV